MKPSLAMRNIANRERGSISELCHDPSNVAINRYVLGHASYRTSEKYYNQAGSLDASTRLNSAIEKQKAPREKGIVSIGTPRVAIGCIEMPSSLTANSLR
jgi:hypothetical protein